MKIASKLLSATVTDLRSLKAACSAANQQGCHVLGIYNYALYRHLRADLRVESPCSIYVDRLQVDGIWVVPAPILWKEHYEQTTNSDDH